MKREIFFHISDLHEKVVGKKRYLLRREVSKKLVTQYCIRDSKFNVIYKNSWRPLVEQYWEQYFVLLESPINPFRDGDVVYETRGKNKEDYVVYQVINTTKTKAYLKRILVEYEIIPMINREIIVPKKDCFEDDEIIEKPIAIINRDRYMIKLEYGIFSEHNGGFKILNKDKIWVGLD